MVKRIGKDIGGGLVICKATQEDIHYITERFRPAETDEARRFSTLKGKELQEDKLEMFESCWTIFFRGERWGYCGFMPFPNDIYLSNRRFMCYMPCDIADRYKLTYIKESKRVMNELMKLAPDYVDEFYSVPVKAYKMSLKWHERILGAERIGDITFENGELGVLYRLRKGE